MVVASSNGGGSDVPCLLPHAASVAREVNQFGRKINPSEYDELNKNDNLMALGGFLLEHEFMKQYSGGKTWKGKAHHFWEAYNKKGALVAGLQATELLQQALVSMDAGKTGTKSSVVLQTFNTIFNKVNEPEAPLFSLPSDHSRDSCLTKVHALSLKLKNEYPKKPLDSERMATAALEQLLLLFVLHILVIWPLHDDTVHHTGFKAHRNQTNMPDYTKPIFPDVDAEFGDAFFGIDLNWLEWSPKSFVIDLANALDQNVSTYELHQEQRLFGVYIDFLVSLSSTLRNELDEVTMMQNKLLTAFSTVVFSFLSLVFNTYFKSHDSH